MKCIPITCSALLVAAPIFVMLIELVLVAKILEGLQMESKSRKMADLISKFSDAASITKSTSLKPDKLLVVETNSRVILACSAVILFFVTSFCKSLSILIFN